VPPAHVRTIGVYLLKAAMALSGPAEAKAGSSDT